MTESGSHTSPPNEELAGELYAALRSRAVNALARGGSCLDPTDLVHQAWVNLANSKPVASMPRAEFLALCATIMRHIAVDEGRRRLVERREPGPMTLTGFAGFGKNEDVDLLALDDALTVLAKVDSSWARIVELRFFGGMSAEEVSEVMGVSQRSVSREWMLARAWLKRKLR